MDDSSGFRSGKAGVLPLLAVVLLFLIAAYMPARARASETQRQVIFLPTKHGVMAQTISTGEKALPGTAQPQGSNEKPNPAVKLLERTTEKELIANLAALEAGPHDPQTLRYVGSYLAPMADLGWVKGSADVFHRFSAMEPGGLCEHVNRILVQITKIEIEDCDAAQRRIVNLDDPSQSTSDQIRYYALTYNHISFEELCGNGCQETEPFSRHGLGTDEYYCGRSLYHIFRDANGKEYRIIGDLDAREYPYISFSMSWPESAAYLKRLRDGWGLKGAAKKQCRILMKQAQQAVDERAE